MSAPSGTASRFTAPNQSTEQRLSTNVVGLVELSDFKKRKAQVLEQQEREAREAAQKGALAQADGAGGDDASGKESGDGIDKADGADGEQPKKKRQKSKEGKKKKSKGRVNTLSFLGDDDDDGDADENDDDTKDKDDKDIKPSHKDTQEKSAVPAIKSFTAQALRKQAAEREALRKEFLLLQAGVKATEVAVPFVFYEGTNIPGGVVRVKKGDYVWLMLDRSRKVGARLGEKQHESGGDGGGAAAAADAAGTTQNGADAQNQQRNQPRPNKARMHWARINVDDLMLVRGNLIIPHHYDFYYFIINKSVGPGGVRIFDYSNDLPDKAAAPKLDGLDKPTTTSTSTSASASASDYAHLEGAHDDPSLTKVVDRRWYERNKHIYPASLWQEFDPEADYTQQVRRDQGGNAFFFAPK